MGRSWWWLLMLQACTASGPPPERTPYVLALPEGFPAMPVPKDNPVTAEKVELGRRLFYDKRLSINETVSCGSCHQQALAFTDGRPQSIGATARFTPRGAMSLANIGYAATLTWANNQVLELEQQAQVPMFGISPIEMGLAGREPQVVTMMAQDAWYPRLFASAFPDQPVSMENAVKAIASFERTLLSGDSPVDRFSRGDTNALSPAARRGMEKFSSEALRCAHCHGGFAFTDSVRAAGSVVVDPPFHNTGLYNVDANGSYPPPSPGLSGVTMSQDDVGRFKAPTLRNIAVTAPYMHDGSIPTLEEVLAHYARGGRMVDGGSTAGDGRLNPHKDPLVAGFPLSDGDQADLLAFLVALTDETFLHNAAQSDPFAGP